MNLGLPEWIVLIGLFLAVGAMFYIGGNEPPKAQ